MKYLGSNAAKYGKTFLFWPGNKAMLVCMDQDIVRQVLTDTKTFVKGDDYTMKFSVVFGEGLVTANGERHKHDRSCLGKYFLRSSIEKQLEMICTQTKKAMDEVLEAKGVGTGKEIDVQDYFHLITLRIFGALSVSHDYGAPENQKFAKWMNHAVSWGSHVIGEHIILGLPMWNIIPNVRKLRFDIMAKLNVHFDELIDSRIAARKAGEETPDDALEAMLNDQQERNHMRYQLCTMLAAGHDTTAFFGCYMSFLIAKDQRVQDKIKEEVSRVLGSRDQITNDDIDNLKYCRMVMQETLRLYTIIPFVNRTTTKDAQIRDSKMVIPKDTVVLVPLTLMNRDKETWENPNEFRPERFSPEEKNIGGHTSAKNGYLPFGYGSRTCIGNHLALIEGTCMIALLMQKYRFFPVEGFKPALIPGISLVSKNGVKVKVERDVIGGPDFVPKAAPAAPVEAASS